MTSLPVEAALRELADPRPGGDRVKAAIDRAAKRAGLSYWRAFDIWYGKARRVEEFERDAISEALNKKREEAARNEFHELKTRLLRLESILVQTDPDFHRPTVDGVREQMRGLGGGNRTLAKGVTR
jgi:hypothetical protein